MSDHQEPSIASVVEEVELEERTTDYAGIDRDAQQTEAIVRALTRGANDPGAAAAEDGERGA